MASATTALPDGRRARRGIRVRGTVQGIGFRPTVYRIATELALGGKVRNDSDGVWIEIEGAPETLDRFVERLGRDLPVLAPLGKIVELSISELAVAGDQTFQVVASEEAGDASEPGGAIVPADASICDDCLRELFDRHDRRARYPFINCTACGPRYTIVRDVPYDRVRTTMAAFALCERCRAEYEDPKDRRFHAEPNACATCGPRLTFHGAGEQGPDALRAAVADLCAGRIVAVKGLGGFHLACDAEDEPAVARLRERKRRPDKPFAVMVRSLAEAETLVELDEVGRAALRSAARPIVLAPARAGNGLARSVAPGLGEIGVMLAYTPLHHLLLAEGPPVLVMTSGNRTEEPIARENDDARMRLGDIADSFLVHDREIHTRADDSVVRVVAGVAQPVRRSRGWVPEPIELGFASSAPSICAVGAELKNTVCITRGGEAYLSPHVGDLENAETYAFFVEVIEKLGRLLGVTPAIVAHDLHPDYLSTRWALQNSAPREPVQHHHAHVASCLVDNGRIEPVIGVAFDGTGCGPAGDLWGGEILLCDLARSTRLAHLRPLALCGGEAAIREPWRVAAAALIDSGLDLTPLIRIDARLRSAIGTLFERAPRATGAGRWFDAAAALTGVRDVISYEGQAAMELEAMAAAAGAHETVAYPFAVDERAGHPDVHDLRPAVRALVGDVRRGVGKPVLAARFHRTMARVVLEAARRGRAAHDVAVVALSGGCFQNRILTEAAKELLEADGFEVLVHRRVPPNDGGVALGQAAVAARRWLERQNGRSHVSGNSG